MDACTYQGLHPPVPACVPNAFGFTANAQEPESYVQVHTKSPSQLADFAKNIAVERSIRPQSPIVTIGEDAIAKGDIREVAPGPKVFTDDLAPVEDLIDRILLDYARKGGS